MTTTIQKIAGFSSNPMEAFDRGSKTAFIAHSAWKAFQSGMQILHRYANRSPIDIDTVAKSNLRLLHRSLLYNPHYVNYIENIKYDSTKSGLAVIRRIYTNEEIIADLIAVKKDSVMNLKTLPQHYTMYLFISGNAQLGTNIYRLHPLQHWWNFRPTKNGNHILRNRAVIICSPGQKNKQITSNKDCMILRIQISLATSQHEIAS